ncbi:hypothetical protein MFERI13461_00176 [Mycoplasma feriruminatoris]|uniref:MAG4940 family membrane protein n=1 Tax=Mycoplasma feriruminatoris TaxID=1179777 RepID=UPI00241D4DF1|nr:hypothetical protein [Mycoplasma feriruminatoris]WFQ90759.1 hypothetical protein MFERI13461_00176 [Mycoplasma feriruminatoris]
MTNQPGNALRTFFNPTVFSFELLSVATLVFLVFLWKLFAVILKKQHNKIFISSGYTIATLLAFYLPWAFSSIASQTSVYPFLNPLSVFYLSVLKGLANSGQVLNSSNTIIGSPLLKGIPYILTGQLIGGFLGFGLFVLLFYLIKKVNQNDLENNINHLTMTMITRFNDKSSIKWYTIKEAAFITMLMLLLPLISMTNTAFYKTNDFQVKLIEGLVVGVIIFASSFVNFFCFHLFFLIINIIFKTVSYLKLEKQLKQESDYYKDLTKFFIVLILSIIIPMILAFLAILIKMASGVYISVS